MRTCHDNGQPCRAADLAHDMKLLEASTNGLKWLGAGVECSVWQWGHSDWCIKTFATEDEARIAFEWQAEGADACLAPAVDRHIGVFRIWNGSYDCHRHSLNRWRWGYLSEIVSVGDLSETEIGRLYEDLREAELPCCDLHSANMGRLPDGTPCRIDWGERST